MSNSSVYLFCLPQVQGQNCVFVENAASQSSDR